MELDRKLLEIADELERRSIEKRTARLLPLTALYCATGLRTFVASPDRDFIVPFLCSSHPRCADPCISCIGKANTIHQQYTGAKPLPAAADMPIASRFATRAARERR